MADVAAAAGVSGQTVSRVVNDSPRVDPATRGRVERAMADLGYRPHRAARALRTGRTETIGLIVSTLASVGNSRMLQAIADAASDRGYALTVVTAAGADAVAQGFARLHDQGVDGAIVLNEATAAARGVDVPEGLALVVVDSAPDDRYVVVQTDHAAGAATATAHLLALGRGPVWHLAGPAGSYAADERERGWRAALADAGTSVPESLRGDWTAASGHTAGLDLPAEARAVFAANDQMALGLLRALAETGRAVPDDVAVVGFDDVTDAADYRPPLTTVRQDFDALGAAAVAALADAIAGAPSAGVVLTPELVARASA
ncbi:LacI family DNA-binding transcriptional regulator [Microbacterium telephonicum]|nr:LacI family DNA-binding transcriptional regulator [Microbacterium telephonicum]